MFFRSLLERLGMHEVRSQPGSIEIAAHVPTRGMKEIRLHGGPWNDRVVGVRSKGSQWIKVNGPRNGDHRVWIVHYYELRESRYEFDRTEVFPIEENAGRAG